uniref:Cysteine protease inhibitor n=1 Tax=Loa loa TaxID=7209 RepID=A0A1I7VZG2_LOALO
MSIKEGSLVVLLFLFGVSVCSLSTRKQEATHMESEIHQMPPRQEILLGGWSERNPEEDEIQKLLLNVLTKVNQQSNDEYHLMPIKVVKVSSQVVAGMRYKMDVQVARSECKKSSKDQVDLKTCKRLEGHPDQVMTLDIWEKPWENFLQVKILETKVLSSV